MTSKSEGCEPFAKSFCTTYFSVGHPQRPPFCTHAHIHTQQGQLLFFFFFSVERGKTTALKRQPRHTVVTHTRYPKKPFYIVQLVFFFSCSTSIFFLCFIAHVSAFLAHTTTMWNTTWKKKKESRSSLTRRLPIPAPHLVQCTCYNAPDALVTMHQKKMAVATVDLSSTMPWRNEKCTTKKYRVTNAGNINFNERKKKTLALSPSCLLFLYLRRTCRLSRSFTTAATIFHKAFGRV